MTGGGVEDTGRWVEAWVKRMDSRLRGNDNHDLGGEQIASSLAMTVGVVTSRLLRTSQ